MKLKFKLFTFFILILNSCADNNSEYYNINNCNNIFMVNTWGGVYLMKYNENSKMVNVIRTFSNKDAITVPYYDCKQNRVILPYLYKDNKRISGMYIHNLNNNNVTDYNFNQGGASFVYPYKNGLFFTSSLLNSSQIDTTLGYFSESEVYERDGELIHISSYMNFFDLEKNSFTKSYKMHLSPYVYIKNDYMYGAIKGSYVKVDLKTGKRYKIFKYDDYVFPENAIINTNDSLTKYSRVPVGRTYKVDENIYHITDENSHNISYSKTSNGLIGGWEKNTIYRFDKDKCRKEYKIPFKSIGYIVTPDDENFYIFERATGKIIVYSTKKHKVIKETEFKNKGYSVFSITFNKNNFIVGLIKEPVGKKEYAAISIIPRDLSNKGSFFSWEDLNIKSNLIVRMTITTTDNNTNYGTIIRTHYKLKYSIN